MAGSKEARELEKIKRAFDKAYKETAKAKTDTKYSLGNGVENIGDVLYNGKNPLSIVDRAKPNKKSSINWVYESEIFSVTENKLFHEKISEINQGSRAFEKNSNGEYMLPIGNKIVFTDGNYDSPYIREIIEVLTEYSTDFEDIKECIYSVEKGESEKSEASRYVQNTFGEGRIVSYTSRNNGVHEWENGKSKGKTRRTVVRNYLNKQYGRGNDNKSRETPINDIAPVKETSSKDGVFFDGKKAEYSLSPAELDKQYLSAVKNNDTETAQKIVDDFVKQITKSADNGNLVKIKNRSNQVSELTAPIADSYDKNTPDDSISNSIENVKKSSKDSDENAKYSLGPAELDKQYISAVKNNDIETAQKIVDDFVK